MQIPREAIEKAIEGGWKHPFGEATDTSKTCDIGNNTVCCEGECRRYEQIALDPDFWFALGKALGWKEWKTTALIYDELTWYYHAHRFYDLILTKQPTDAFWEEILR